MIVVWQIVSGADEVEVFEDGRVHSANAVLEARVRDLLREPVDVTRTGAGGIAMVLAPGDRRYVVARVRRMVEDEADMVVVGVRFAGDDAAD